MQELEQQLLQLSPNDKLYIIQLLVQSLTAHLQPETQTKTTEYPLSQFYECIQYF